MRSVALAEDVPEASLADIASLFGARRECKTFTVR